MDTVFIASEEEHQKALVDVKNMIEKDTHLTNEMLINDRLINRCLWAKRNNPKAAFHLIKAYYHWHKNENTEVPLQLSDVREFLLKGIFNIPPIRDNDNFPILYMRVNLYKPSDIPHREVARALSYLIEFMTMEDDAAKYGITFIGDMQGWGWSNFSIAYAKSFFDTLQGCFPLRVRKFILVNPPSYFKAVYKMIHPMLGEDLADKFILISDKNIGEYVDPTRVPKEVGGTGDFPSPAEFIQQLK